MTLEHPSVCISVPEVSKVQWHMFHYGGATPKPHYAYGNSTSVSKLGIHGKLKGWKEYCRQNPNRVRTAESYTDKAGKRRFKGNPKVLQASESLCCYAQVLCDKSWSMYR